MDYIAMLEGVQMPGTQARSLGRPYGRPVGRNSYRAFGRSFVEGVSCADPCTPRPNADCTPRGNADCMPRGNADCAPCQQGGQYVPPAQQFIAPPQEYIIPPVIPPQGQGQPQGQQPGGPFVDLTKTTPNTDGSGTFYNPGSPTPLPAQYVIQPINVNPALLVNEGPQGLGRLGRLGRIFSGR